MGNRIQGYYSFRLSWAGARPDSSRILANPHLIPRKKRAQEETRMDWSHRLKRILGSIPRWLGRGWQRTVNGLLNFRRWTLQRRWPDYIVFELTGELQERIPEMPRWYAYLPGLRIPLTLEHLDQALFKIARDPDVKGVIILVKGGKLSMARAQSMRDLFRRFRAWDREHNRIVDGVGAKEVVVLLEQTSVATYLMASAADRIFFTPLTTWAVLGLRSEQVFLKETLDRVGVQAEVVQIAPWKTAGDNLARSDMSEADREQRTWLLDSLYEQLVEGIAQGRSLEPERVRELIDQAPLLPDEALAAGLIDGILYEDQLPERLGRLGREARLLPYAKARRYLLRTPLPGAAKRVGVISLTGAIVSGSSRRFPVPLPLFGQETLGSNTVQQLARAAMEDDRLAAVVVYVDSPGGSALASDIMWRELNMLGRQKPLVVYMGDVAGSGGYYISAPGRKIVAQPATLTGSIGVLALKPVTGEMYRKMAANRVALQRGENADLFSDQHPWRKEQREKVEQSIRRTYHEFKQRVAEGRGIPFEELDPICSGKVWTGAQAREHGLVDELGDFRRAYELACELAELPTDGRVPTVRVRAREHLMARSARSLGLENILRLGEGTSHLVTALAQGDWRSILGQESLWLIADGLPRVE